MFKLYPALLKMFHIDNIDRFFRESERHLVYDMKFQRLSTPFYTAK